MVVRENTTTPLTTANMLIFQALGGGLDSTIGLLCVGFGVLLVCFGLGWQIVRASKRNTDNKQTSPSRQTDKSSWGAAKRQNDSWGTDNRASNNRKSRAEDSTSADGGLSNDTGDFVFTDEEADKNDFVFTDENDESDDERDQRPWGD
ncbi:hypothetical protein ACFQL7_07590 [Halocatena marina]|uniref:LapA family protein n=1 Tax=Halocatena marina TaxID=2934937 RepID=A0ABD5YKG0_9EURY